MVTADIHCVNLDCGEEHLDRWRAILPHDELVRADQFRQASDRRRYILRRGCLRRLLCRYTDAPASRIRFHYNAWGRPELPSGRLRFSLSHSREQALFAFVEGAEIGCDLEWRDPEMQGEDLAEYAFTAAERIRWTKLARPTDVGDFFVAWTLKEACLKARGCGLATGEDGGLGTPSTGAWLVRGFRPARGFQAAVAVTRPDVKLRFHRKTSAQMALSAQISCPVSDGV
jgi:4'-phosphopantetheinyl transferase